MKKLMSFLDKFTNIVSCIGFAIMFFVVCGNVFSRYVLGKSFSWAEEISYFCFVWSVFMGVCILYKKQALISIDVLVNRLSAKGKRMVHILTFALMSVVNLTLAVYSWKLANGAWIRPTASLRIPYFYMDMAATVGFCILLFYSLYFLVMSIKNEEINETLLEERS